VSVCQKERDVIHQKDRLIDFMSHWFFLLLLHWFVSPLVSYVQFWYFLTFGGFTLPPYLVYWPYKFRVN